MGPTFVRTWIHRETVESTSDLAKELVLGGLDALPLVVTAGRQTRGRGRGEHVWWSDEGSLTLTVVIDPRTYGMRPDHEPRIALATAVAVVGAINPLISPYTAGIRWPNDVEVDGRKVGGLLPERIDVEGKLRIAVGVGLNVLTRTAQAPPQIRAMAVSLAELASSPLDRDDLSKIRDDLLERFDSSLRQLSSDDATLAERWSELDTLRGERLRVALGPRIVAGTGRGIDAEGALLVDVDGEVIPFFGGQILRERHSD